DYLGCLPLFPGMPILITKNLSVTRKVVNGACSTMHDIIFCTSFYLFLHRCVYVAIPASTLQLPGEDTHIVAVFPQPYTFSYFSDHAGKLCITCRQVPVVWRWAFTDYKAQGTTLNKIIVDLVSARGVQHAYIMLS
ncbi:hypothetical protein M404DRAFT_77765, partial [Pisolithus tinctorius Marx 270]